MHINHSLSVIYFFCSEDGKEFPKLQIIIVSLLVLSFFMRGYKYYYKSQYSPSTRGYI